MDQQISPIQKEKKTVHTITLVKGMVIILVVIGHYFPESSPDYWLHLRHFIYRFHMPLFFVLSGFLFQFSCIQEKRLFPFFIVKKIKRLIIPFLVIAIIFLIIKTITGIFISLEFPVTLSSIANLFINPVKSFAPLLWFIYTLFFIQIFFQSIQLLVKHTFIILIISIILMFIPIPATTVIYYLFLNLPFFVIGYILSKKAYPDTISLSMGIISSIIFLGCFFLTYQFEQLWGTHIVLSKLFKFIISTSLSLLCICLASLLVKIRHLFMIKILGRIGLSAMGIYLLHTVFVSFIRIIFGQIFSVNLPFIIIAIPAILSGLIFPIIIEQVILRPHKLTRGLILGIK